MGFLIAVELIVKGGSEIFVALAARATRPRTLARAKD
jgi:hypothetical protein